MWLQQRSQDPAFNYVFMQKSLFYGVASASFTELHLLDQTLAESDRLFKRPNRRGRAVLLNANARSHAINNGKAEF